MSRPAAVIDLSCLPRRVRVRLWCDSRVDHLASWLVARGRWRLAMAVWKAYGAW